MGKLASFCGLNFLVVLATAGPAVKNFDGLEDLESLEKLKDVDNYLSFPQTFRFPDPTTLGFHPHIQLKTLEIVKYHGYVGELHVVTTEDGYQLELHRIVGKDNAMTYTNNSKPAVLLMHGILASSSDWVMSGPNKALAFILSDAGYDVWMGNARGNRYSRKHISISVFQSKFWQFSWHEIGMYDLPAKVDYILKVTGQSKISYVGHSQGTTASYVMASTRPEYNDKLNVMASLAPVAYSGNMFSPLMKFLAEHANEIGGFIRLLGIDEVRPTTELLKVFTNKFCRPNSAFQDICLNFVFMICGYDRAQMNTTLLPAILSHMPAGSSVRQFIHYAQLINTKEFRQFDYGMYANKRIYGTQIPPRYPVENITVPVFLYYGENDWLSHPQDVSTLHENLANGNKYRVPYNKFNHLDHLYAINSDTLVYQPLLNTLKRYYK